MLYQKNKNLVILLISALGLAAIAVFVVYPNFREIIKINQEINTETISLEQKLALGMNIRKIKADLESVKGSLGEIDQIFIKKNQELEFFSQLENLAAKHQLIINLNPDFSGKESPEGIKTVSLQINLAGDYPKLLAFLKEMESLPAYYQLQTIFFSSNQRSSDKKVSLQLIGNVYLK